MIACLSSSFFHFFFFFGPIMKCLHEMKGAHTVALQNFSIPNLCIFSVVRTVSDAEGIKKERKKNTEKYSFSVMNKN